MIYSTGHQVQTVGCEFEKDFDSPYVSICVLIESILKKHGRGYFCTLTTITDQLRPCCSNVQNGGPSYKTVLLLFFKDMSKKAKTYLWTSLSASLPATDPKSSPTT